MAIPEVAMVAEYSTVSEFHTTLVPATSASLSYKKDRRRDCGRGKSNNKLKTKHYSNY